MTLRPRRSALYMPASNTRAIAKARSLDCDVVALDLEDAVAPDLKASAREQAVAAVREGGFGRRELVVRVNGPDTPWGADARDQHLRETAFTWMKNAGMDEGRIASRTLQSRKHIAELGDSAYGEIGPEIADNAGQQLDAYFDKMGFAL